MTNFIVMFPIKKIPPYGQGLLELIQASYDITQDPYLAPFYENYRPIGDIPSDGLWLEPACDPAAKSIAFTDVLAGYTPIYSIAGVPAMSVPLHWTAGGLPVGSHFAAGPGREDLLFGLAYALEEVAPWQGRKPLCGNHLLPPLRGFVLRFDLTPGLRPGLLSGTPSGCFRFGNCVSRQKLSSFCSENRTRSQ